MWTVQTNETAAADSTLTVGIMGAGAVGMFLAARLARGGTRVVAVARPGHVEAVTGHGLQVASVDGPFVAHPTVSADPGVLRGCHVVLVCVKTVDTDATALLLDGVLGAETLVVSVQNGVDNAWRLRERLSPAVVPAVVYVSAEMTGPGQLRHNGGGRLIVGAPLADERARPEAQRRLAALARALQHAGVPCQTSDDVRVDLWTKLTANCAYNAISALSGQRYGRLAADDGVQDVMQLVTDEIAAVAAADGVPVTRAALGDAVAAIARIMPQALSSTAQDLQAGRRTEIDDLNGFVVRRGTTLGVPTPVNRTLQALVKFAERSRSADQ